MKNWILFVLFLVSGCGASSVQFQDAEINDRYKITGVGIRCGCQDVRPVYGFCVPVVSGKFLMSCHIDDIALIRQSSGYCCQTTGGRIPYHYVEARPDPRDAIEFPLPMQKGQWALDIANGLYGFYVW